MGNNPRGGHDVVPGQCVMVQKYVTDTLGPTWDGPYQSSLITRSAVKVQGKIAMDTCHSLQCCRYR